MQPQTHLDTILQLTICGAIVVTLLIQVLA